MISPDRPVLDALESVYKARQQAKAAELAQHGADFYKNGLFSKGEALFEQAVDAGRLVDRIHDIFKTLGLELQNAGIEPLTIEDVSPQFIPEYPAPQLIELGREPETPAVPAPEVVPTAAEPQAAAPTPEQDTFEDLDFSPLIKSLKKCAETIRRLQVENGRELSKTEIAEVLEVTTGNVGTMIGMIRKFAKGNNQPYTITSTLQEVEPGYKGQRPTHHGFKRVERETAAPQPASAVELPVVPAIGLPTVSDVGSNGNEARVYEALRSITAEGRIPTVLEVAKTVFPNLDVPKAKQEISPYISFLRGKLVKLGFDIPKGQKNDKGEGLYPLVSTGGSVSKELAASVTSASTVLEAAAGGIETEEPVIPILSEPEQYLFAQALSRGTVEALAELGVKIAFDDKEALLEIIEKLEDLPGIDEILANPANAVEVLSKKLAAFLKDTTAGYKANEDSEDAQFLLAFLVGVRDEFEIRELLNMASVSGSEKK